MSLTQSPNRQHHMSDPEIDPQLPAQITPADRLLTAAEFHRLIPEDQLFTGNDLTFSIEQDNSNIRHFLARFRRRTKVVSKAVEMVDLSLRIYHHFHDNPRNFAATFLCIFS